ncbi:MAG: MarR family transcriptional regulator [candidate division WOR-3 bacterium]|nr:MAG: MarR family transcriptional regulator [candidate division WOR-3 bacterium]
MKRQRHGGFLIAKIHQIAGRIFGKKLRNAGIDLNPAQGRIIFVLWHTDRIPISELAQKTSLGKSTLTSMIDRLEASGYVTRIPCSEDRREILIERTDKDKAFEKIYTRLSGDMTRLFYHGFSNKEISQFEDCLVRIYENLAGYEAQSGSR